MSIRIESVVCLFSLLPGPININFYFETHLILPNNISAIFQNILLSKKGHRSIFSFSIIYIFVFSFFLFGIHRIWILFYIGETISWKITNDVIKTLHLATKDRYSPVNVIKANLELVKIYILSILFSISLSDPLSTQLCGLVITILNVI